MFKKMMKAAVRRIKIVYDWMRVRFATQYISGEREIVLRDDDVGLVCLIKDGEYYIQELLRHHRSIGVKHFLFIDNGSKDKTMELLCSHDDVTLVVNKLPVKIYEIKLRSQLARMTFRGGWLLFVDSDELIKLPMGENKKISEFINYCNIYKYDVVVGQCLDLFSSELLSFTKNISYQESVKIFNKYSLKCIDEFDYDDKENVHMWWFLRENTISNGDIKIKYGGVRKELFGEYCCLTNHRLVRNSAKIGIYTHPHCCSNARCADFTLLLCHYKFAGKYIDRERIQLIAETWQHNENKLRILKTSKINFKFQPREILQYESTSKLVEEGFLTCSNRFRKHFLDFH